MRRSGEASPSSSSVPDVRPPGAAPKSDWATLARLFPYLWQYKWRVIAALGFMVGAKLANVSVPLLLKELIDGMTFKPTDPTAVLVVPMALLAGYGALRLSTSLFTELRELVFAKATQGAARSIALETFEHLHALSLRFHLDRQTGGMTRDIERGVRGIESLISFSLYSIVPTLIEVTLVLSILAVKFDAWFAWITIAALVFYIFFTVTVTEWRTKYRKQANEFDSAAHSKAIDSLLNYETVKYFNNEGFEAKRYDQSLESLRRARSQEPDQPEPAQHRAAAHHCHRPGGHAVARHAGRGGRAHDAGRSGDGQRLHDPALHPAELFGRDLPRDQTKPDRPGQDVHPDGP
jgi:ABC-type multidrug transport system fused ATPase/permease subunit